MRALVIRTFGSRSGPLGRGQRLLEEIDELRAAARRADRVAAALLNRAVAESWPAVMETGGNLR